MAYLLRDADWLCGYTGCHDERIAAKNMANTLEDLYLKYVDGVGQNVEDDKYFRYLYAMIEAGSNIMQQKHQILNKIVDEQWISTIEDSLDAINNIIENPRRFITTIEEVVPVSLAKKITAESVRHLSMNTQFIASTENGDVQPTKILNVSTEESYDLYENRFIYHLISRLIAFVDKRTDVIFWSTGNETSNTLAMESNVDDAYEQINYKVSMTIKNTQSLVENDNDNMQVFMRIDRVRRMVFALRSTAFYSLMNGCAKVHSPIQRTNLMMKDPDYRACYKLWQFLESYDEVGYSIEPIESTLEFDEEYMIQMYSNMIANYTIFKSILEPDGRDLKELEKKELEPVKPKFIKEIKEVIVENRDLPDVEIRQVFVEEVTEAQLEAEAKLAEMTTEYEEMKKRCEEAEESEAEAQRQMQGLYQQLSAVMEQQVETEDELEKTLQEKEEQSQTYEDQISEQKEGYESQISGLKETHESQILELKEACESQISELKEDYESKIEKLIRDHEAKLGTQKESYEEQLSSVKADYEGQFSAQKESYEGQLSHQKEGYEEQLSSVKADYESQFAELKQNYESETENLTSDYEFQLVIQKKSSESQLSSVKADYESQLSTQKEDYENQLSSVKADYESQFSIQKADYENQLSSQKADYESQLSTQKSDYDNQMEQLQIRVTKAEDMMMDALKKSEGTRLSRYIISRLKNKGEDDDKED